MTQFSLFNHDGRTRAVSTAEEFDVYAGRSGTIEHGAKYRVPVGDKGWLGNPWPVKYFPDALELFRKYFTARVEAEPAFRVAVLALRGKRLGCPGCATGAPCHARIVAEWVEAQPITRAKCRECGGSGTYTEEHEFCSETLGCLDCRGTGNEDGLP